MIFLLSELLLFCFKRKYILFLETYFFKIPKNLIASTFLSSRGRSKNASEKASNVAVVKRTDWNIKNDHVINCALFFCKS